MNTTEIPAHSHQLNASKQGGFQFTPFDYYLLTSDITLYAPPSAGNSAMAANEVSNTGGGQAHNNMQPYQAVNFIICLQGVFPPRS